MNQSTRLRLHGNAVSNYFDAAHAALIEKGASFELVDTHASQAPEFLAMNPMGKIPILETGRGCIAETIAIFEYLEDTLPAPPLYPQDPYLRARARQIINVVQCYIEAPARSLYPGVFMGGTNGVAAIDAAEPAIQRGVRALGGLVDLQPWLVADSYSYADVFVFFCLNLVDRLTQAVYQWSVVDEIPGLHVWFARVAQRESSRAVLDGFRVAFTAYLAEKDSTYLESTHKSDEFRRPGGEA